MKYGFTLIELLIVSGITLVLVAAAFPIYSNLQSSSQLNEAAAQFLQNLRLERTMSIARLQNASHGIYFDIDPAGPDGYVVFQGASYASRVQSYDHIVRLDAALSLSPALTQGAQEIVFSRAFGLPSATGTIMLTHSIAGERTMTVNAIGTSEYE